MERYNSISWEIVDEGIGLLTLNRPEAYNAVDGEMLMSWKLFWRFVSTIWIPK